MRWKNLGFISRLVVNAAVVSGLSAVTYSVIFQFSKSFQF